MSKYTTEVRFICETAYGLNVSKGADSVDEILNGSVDKIFNFTFPIFDEAYRKVLETKILKHFYTREIAFETVGLWKLKLNTKLNEIMPYYNLLYKSELLEFNPLYTKNITREHNTRVENKGESKVNSENNSTSQATTNSQNTNWDTYSDTPQGALTNVENGTYLTNARKNADNGSSQSNGYGSSTSNESGSNTSNSVENYLEKVSGYDGYNPSKLLKDFRDTFLNIDMLVIEELEELFFQLW